MVWVCGYDLIFVDLCFVFGLVDWFLGYCILDGWLDEVLGVLGFDVWMVVVILIYDSKLDDLVIECVFGLDVFYLGCLGFKCIYVKCVECLSVKGF